VTKVGIAKKSNILKGSGNAQSSTLIRPQTDDISVVEVDMSHWCVWGDRKASWIWWSCRPRWVRL